MTDLDLDLGLDGGRRARPAGLEVSVHAGQVRDFAAATNDPNVACRSGVAVPAGFVLPLTWAALEQVVRHAVPTTWLATMMHSEQDIHQWRPLVPGERLRVSAEPYSGRVSAGGTRLTLRTRVADVGGEAVVEHFTTLFFRGRLTGQSAGPPRPDHTLPRSARSRVVGAWDVPVDADQARRYSAAAGDPNPIHLDPALARAVGLPGVILQGACAAAMVGAEIVARVAGGDATRVSRSAVQFVHPIVPGVGLRLTAYRLEDTDQIGFEAHTAAGDLVLRSGRVCLAAPAPTSDWPSHRSR